MAPTAVELVRGRVLAELASSRLGDTFGVGVHLERSQWTIGLVGSLALWG